LQESTPPQSPTEYPPVTLTVRHPLAATATQSTGISYLSTPSPLLTPKIAETSAAEDATLHPFSSLLLSSPTCYDAPTGGLICLGEIKNDGDTSAGLLEVQVQVLKADHTLVAERVMAVEQRTLPPGQSAPYRAQFSTQDLTPFEDGLFITYSLVRAKDALEDNLVPLVIEEESGAMVEGRYVISATLYNPSRLTADAIRLVATLRDRGGRISGYRVLELSQPLEAQMRVPVVVSVMAQDTSSDLTHDLYAEGLVMQ
jgi:hypothetical protein